MTLNINFKTAAGALYTVTIACNWSLIACFVCFTSPVCGTLPPTTSVDQQQVRPMRWWCQSGTVQGRRRDCLTIAKSEEAWCRWHSCYRLHRRRRRCYHFVASRTCLQNSQRIWCDIQRWRVECSPRFVRPWARRWIDHWSLWRMASATPDLRLPFQPHCITASWPVWNYSAWWQRHMCVNNLPKVVTWKHYLCQPHYCYRPHYLTARFRSPSLYMVSDRRFRTGQGPCRTNLHK